MPFWSFKNLSDEESELRIDGEIVEDGWAWIYEWFGEPYASPNKFRKALKDHKGKNITVWIDSWGGDVFAGVGIYNALKEHKGKVTVKVDGKAVSAGSLIAMAGDEIFMSPGSILMIHNPWSLAIGEAKDMRKSADVLDEVKEAILNIYQTRVDKSREEISELMDNEEWMSAKKAVKEGFADGILHLDNEEDESISNSFSVSRLAVMNSAESAMVKFFEKWAEFQQEKHPETPEVPEGPEVTPSNRINNIKMRVSVREKQNRRYA